MAFGSFGAGEGLLWYGICARCAKQAPVVRDVFSEALRAQKGFLGYARVVVCEYVIGYFRRTDNSLKLSATLSGDGIV